MTDAVSAVIATYRSHPGRLPVVVDRLLDQSADEVVVVLDGRQPNTLGALASIDRAGLRVIELPVNLGQARAKLHGVRAAAGRVVLMVDDDIVIDDGVVDRQRVLHAGRDDLVVVGHIPVPSGGGVASRVFGAEYRDVVARWEREPETILEGVYGGLMSTPRSLYLAADEHLTTTALPYYEDLDLGLRLRAVGGVGRFDRASSGVHHHVKSLESFVVESRRRQSSRSQLVERWGAVPRFTRRHGRRVEQRARRVYRRVGALPGVDRGVVTASISATRIAGGLGWRRTEEYGARILRVALEEGQEARNGTSGVGCRPVPRRYR
ncbi:MAG: glycosyltransferase family 2 protein [Desertimonas sp.]